MTQAEQRALVGGRAHALERRRHQRVKVAVLGRYMLESRQEFPCQTVDMSPGGAHLLAPVKGAVGERVVAYFDYIGRIEGEITRQTVDGFAMTVVATPRKRDKIAAQLTWLANRHVLSLPEDRRYDRVVPRNTSTVLKLSDGSRHSVHIIDVSPSGAALLSSIVPPLGTPVTLGRTSAAVVRHFSGGIAIAFDEPLPEQDFARVIEF